MVKIKLYHNILLNKDEVNEKQSWAVAKYELQHVATSRYDVLMEDVDDNYILEQVWEASNNGVPGRIPIWTDNAWWDMVDVRGCRSTMVGDRVLLQRDDKEPKCYEVAGVGWTEVSAVPV